MPAYSSELLVLCAFGISDGLAALWLWSALSPDIEECLIGAFTLPAVQSSVPGGPGLE